MIGRTPSEPEPTDDENREMNSRLLQLEPGEEIRIYLWRDKGDRTLTVERHAENMFGDRHVVVCSGYGTEYELQAFTDDNRTRYQPKVKTSTVQDSITGIELLDEQTDTPADMDSDATAPDPEEPPSDDECEHLNVAIQRLSPGDAVTVYLSDGSDRTLEVAAPDDYDVEVGENRVCRVLTGYGTAYFLIGSRRPDLDVTPRLEWSSGCERVYHLEGNGGGFIDAEKTAGELLWRVGIRDGQ